jgi:hypothetical protein
MRTPHSDEPTLDDLLDHKALAVRVASRVRDVPTPYVLGIHGDWGTGKSSLLLKIKDELDRPHGRPGKPDPGRVVVRFEAWKHQFEDQPVIGLLHAIRAEFTAGRRFLNATKKVISIATYGALSVIDDLAAAIGAGPLPKGIAKTAREEGERYEKAEFAVPLQSEAVQALFAQAVEELLGKKERLVVLVDDLDRCADTSIVRLLESIKLYLNVKRCVFVVAADREAVVRAVQRGLFGGDPDKGDDASARTRERAEAYVEKLFQSVDQLPVGPPIDRFVGKLCVQWPCGGAPLLASLAWRAPIVPPNPRRVKRFISEVGVRVDAWEELYGGSPSEEEWRVLVAVQNLATFHPMLYRRLEADFAFWDRLVEFTANPPMDAQRMEPFQRLRLPDQRNAGSEGWESNHPDPGAMSVLHVARLLRDIGQVPTITLRRALLIAPVGA